MKNIPFFNYPALFREEKLELMPIIEGVLERGAFVMQEDLFSFERNLAEYLGVKHAFGVADGTIAIMMALRCAGVTAGHEVVVPSHTFVASAAAVHHVGAIPVLAECAGDHLIDSADVAERITDKTKAIMPVQLNGRTTNMDPILELAAQHELKIVEDSAQALGSKHKGRCAGTFGVAGTCSFYPSKTLGCFGDGGAVFTDSDEAAALIKLMRDHGRSTTGEVVTWGYNSRLDNVQAAVLDFKLKSYPQKIERRRAIARIYAERLRDISELTLPPGPDEEPDHYDIYQNYEIEAVTRDALRYHLKQNGVGTIVQWGGWMIHQFGKLGLNADNLEFTEKLSERFLLLPMNTSLSDEDIHYICDQITRFYRQATTI
ncbi:DegT/DnrJ/EryC1/StrS family aminotransferase [Pseudomonadales bacterium]|nr:DegT/DnrJ/EryC1/StrS family aminotransferase [Pseudomonadales bacterium]MDB2543310.1 DegT/DnrJ/EryC1/StrS family aminotransferase [Pseudomonadales bacterium]